MKLLLAMPSGSGYPHYRASRALYHAQGPIPGVNVDIVVSVMSALAHNFNRVWTKALNEKYDYFAMLHDDVVPEDGWLARLHDILTFKKYDMLSCVIRIKNDTGDTSTATGRRIETGSCHCPASESSINRLEYSFEEPIRLTTKDLKMLPTAFTYDNLTASLRPHGNKGCLLLNTGCWIADLKRRDEWSNCWFQQNDQITRDIAKGEFIPQFEPEDWNFSRLANERGLKLAATTAVPCVHFGHKGY